MKAISILQPFASFWVLGIKRYETRTFNMKFRGLIYVHASKCRDCKIFWKHLVSDHPELAKQIPFKEFDEFPLGAIIGRVNISDVIPAVAVSRLHSDKFFETEDLLGSFQFDRWAIDATDRVMFAKPIPCKGALGLWDVPGDVIKEINDNQSSL